MKVLLRALGVTLPKWYQGLDSWQTETVSTKFISQQGRAVPVGPSLVTGSNLSNSSVLAHPSGPQPPHNDVRCLYTMGQTVSDMNAASNLCTSLCLGADGVRKARLTFLMTADFMTPPSFHPQHQELPGENKQPSRSCHSKVTWEGATYCPGLAESWLQLPAPTAGEAISFCSESACKNLLLDGE